MRVCISVKLSPPGKRNVDGARCTVRHSGSFISSFSSRAGPVAEVALEQPAVDLRPQAARLGDRCRGLPGPLERRGVDRVDAASSAAIRSAAIVGLLVARVGEVQARGAAGQHLAGGRASGRGGPAGSVVAAGCGGFLRRRGARSCWGDVSWWPWGDSNLLSGSVTPLARLDARRGRLPRLPAPRRVARAGRRREAGGVPRRRRTGAGRSPASAIPTPGSSCSGWRRRRTARTAPAGCSPATAAATGCSGRCTGPGSPTSRRRRRSTTACELTRRVGHRGGEVRAARQQAAAGRARRVPRRSSSASSPR